MTSDNVLLQLEPLEDKVCGRFVIPDMGHEDSRRQATALRTARVLAVGPGHRPGCKKCGGQRTHLIPTELKAGDRVIVPALAGEHYAFEVSAPRHYENAPEFAKFGEYDGELRVVREGQCLGVIEE